MAVHHGGKVGRAGKNLASKTTTKSTKSKAGATLANHKAKYHQTYVYKLHGFDK